MFDPAPRLKTQTPDPNANFNTQPVIAYGALSVVANKAGASDCSASSRLYVMDVLSGSRFAGISFVSWTISNTSHA